MKVCPTCGMAFDGPETFCPHDGARLFEAKNKAGQWTGKILANKVKLERHLFADELGERYSGERLDGQGKVRVTLFNMGFEPTPDRIAALRGVRALLESPLPAELTEILDLDLEAPVPYLIESDPQGASLRLLLNEREHFDRPTAMRITCSIARVVEWLDQSAGIYHRALHPQAIYVTQIGKGQVCIAEWAHGILAYKPKPLEAAQQQQAVPYSEYMAPELTDDASRADKRSALYTLGMLLYEMLVGVPAHAAPTVEDVLKRHRRERPGKLSIMSKDPAVGTTLDEIFELITNKDPEARFQAPMALINAMSTQLQAEGDAQFPALERAKDAPAPLKAVEEVRDAGKNGKSAKNGAQASAAQSEPVEEVEDAQRSTMLFIAPSALSEPKEAFIDTSGGSSSTKKRRRRKQADEAKEEPSKPEVKADSATQDNAVEEGVRATEQMDLSEVLAEDRKRQNLKVEVEDPEPEAKADATPSSKIIIDEEALQPSSAVSGQSETQTDPTGLDESSSSAEDSEDQAETTPMTTKKKRRRKKSASSSPKTEAAKPVPEAKVEVKAEPEAKAQDKPQSKVEVKAEPAPAQETKADAPSNKRESDAAQQKPADKSAKAEDTKAKAKTDPAPATTKKEEKLEPPKPATTSAKTSDSGDEALPDTWFTTSTEPAWDQSYLEEHSDQTEKKFRKILMIVMIIFVITCLAFLLYIVFGPENVKDEEARLLIHEATRQVLALRR